MSLLLLAQATWALPLARAGSFDLKDTVDTKGNAGTGEGDFGRKKLTLTGDDVRIGYDDNPLAQPDTVIATIQSNGRRVNVGNVDQRRQRVPQRRRGCLAYLPSRTPALHAVAGR